MPQTSFAELLDVLPIVMLDWLTDIAPLSELTENSQYEFSAHFMDDKAGQKQGSLTVCHEGKVYEQAFVKRNDLWEKRGTDG
jgi:hypothetical protein